MMEPWNGLLAASSSELTPGYRGATDQLSAPLDDRRFPVGTLLLRPSEFLTLPAEAVATEVTGDRSVSTPARRTLGVPGNRPSATGPPTGRHRRTETRNESNPARSGPRAGQVPTS